MIPKLLGHTSVEPEIPFEAWGRLQPQARVVAWVPIIPRTKDTLK